MKRAIVVFLENKRFLMLQFGCLYTSLKHIQAPDTDLVVFGPPAALAKVPDNCVKVPCEPLDAPHWQSYRRINSIACVNSENSDVLDQYDYLLRCDVDTFLTPMWNSFYPEHYLVGRGGYANGDKVRENLKRVAKELGLNHKGVHNLGGSHYGKSKLVKEVYKLIFDVTEHLITVEFKDDPGKWPGWYKGVSIMYAKEIAVNHLVENIVQDRENLDYPSSSHDSIYKHVHIHCWHTDKVFSKFHFEAGKYDHLNTENLDLNRISDYCLYLALQSKAQLPWLGE